MNDGLGGLFTSRINLNLREEKHWSYGTGTILLGARGQRPWITFAPVQTDKTKESLAEIDKEFKDVLGTRPLTAEELQKVQGSETLSLPGSNETQGAVGGYVTNLVEYGLPDDYYDTMATKIRGLRTEDLAKAAMEVVHPDNLIWVVVGDREKITSGVKELGLGEIRYLDADGKPTGGS
jgi:zinc protease